jgi:hypothetical protein
MRPASLLRRLVGGQFIHWVGGKQPEAFAESYGGESLLWGLRHLFINGYVSPGGVLLEGGSLIGADCRGYQLEMDN